MYKVFWIFFNNESDDEYDFSERERHNRISRYYKDIILTYSLTGKTSKKKKKA